MTTIFAIFLCAAAHGSCTQFGRDVYPSLAACNVERAREQRLAMVPVGYSSMCMKASVPAWSPAGR